MHSRSVLRTFPSAFESPLSHIHRYFSSRRRCIAEKARREQSTDCYFLRFLQYTSPSGKELLRHLPAHRPFERGRGSPRNPDRFPIAISPTRSLYNIGNPIQRIGLPYFVKSYYGKRSISPDGFVRPRAELNAIRAAPKQTDDGQPEVRHGESGGFALEPAKTGGSRLPSISMKGCAGRAFAFK